MVIEISRSIFFPRTRLLIHLVDASGQEGRDPLDDYHKIEEELRLYQPELAERPRVVALNKIDLPEAQENLPRLNQAIGGTGMRIFEISAATRVGIDELLQHVAVHLTEMPLPTREQRDETLAWPQPLVDPNLFTIEPERGGFRVRGKKIERLISMTNFAQPEALMRIQRVLEASGISQALLAAGIEEGDPVYVEKAELIWSEQE